MGTKKDPGKPSTGAEGHEFSDALMKRARELLSRRAGRPLEPREVTAALRNLASVYAASLAHVSSITSKSKDEFLDTMFRACDRMRATCEETDEWMALAMNEAHAMTMLHIAMASRDDVPDGPESGDARKGRS